MTSDLPGKIFKIYAKQNKQKGCRAWETENVRQGKTERRWTDMQKQQHTESGGQTEIKRGQFT